MLLLVPVGGAQGAVEVARQARAGLDRGDPPQDRTELRIGQVGEAVLGGLVALARALDRKRELLELVEQPKNRRLVQTVAMFWPEAFAEARKYQLLVEELGLDA